MAISIQASELGLAKIDQIRKRKGWAAIDLSWLEASGVSEATLKRFRLRRPIQREAFVSICGALGLDWEEIAEGFEDLSLKASSYYIQLFPFSNSNAYYNLALSSLPAAAPIPLDHWKACFIKLMPQKTPNFDGDDFDYPDVVLDLGPQGSEDGTVRLHAKFIQGSPIKSVPEDSFAMQSWTRIRLEDGKVYKITTRSNVSTSFRLKKAGTEQWIDEVGGDWPNRGSSSLARTISFSFHVPKSTDYDLYLCCDRLAADSDLTFMLEEEVTASRHPDSEPEVEATKAEASNSEWSPMKTQPQIHWGEAPTVPAFYGREKEIKELGQGIIKYRLVTLLGIKGIGKTALAVKLVEQLQDKFDYIIWRSLDYDPPPTLERLLEDIINFLPNHSETKLPDNLGSKISLLIENLRKHKCLLVLDNVESLMQADFCAERDKKGYEQYGKLLEQANFCAGRYKKGYEQYGELLKRVAKERHQSCIVLTSRENPEEVVELEEKELPVRTFLLEGLTKKDGEKMLNSKGLLADYKKWEELIEIFKGNPLALQIISAKIQRASGGNVSEFLKQYTIITRQISDLLDEQFQCLSDIEEVIVYWLAENSQPDSFSELRKVVTKQETGAELLYALESLLRRGLVKEVKSSYILNELLREYVKKRSKNESFTQMLENCFQKS